MAASGLTVQGNSSPAASSATKDVRQLIMSDAFQAQIKKAMPESMSSDVLLRVAVTTIQKTPRLLECSRESLLQCVLECAQLGLLPDGILGQAYMVPYSKVATLQIGYRGILELARRSNQIKYVVGEAVYTCDKFAITYAPKREITHVPDLENEHRGEKVPEKYMPEGFRGAYALVVYKDDSIDFEYLPLHKIERIRKSSQAGTKADGPWLNHFEEMARKTAIRSLGKRLPLSADDLRHIVADEYREAGVVTGDFASAVSSNVRESIEDAEVGGMFNALGWNHTKRNLALSNFENDRPGLLAYLSAEVAKIQPTEAGDDAQGETETDGPSDHPQTNPAAIWDKAEEKKAAPAARPSRPTSSSVFENF